MNKKRKKNTRLRGSKTHGWGMKKKHSGAGNRGGRGMAGSGKRSDNKKTRILRLYGNNYYGRHGFTRHHDAAVRDTVINIYELDNYPDTVDLGTHGYTKLLAIGTIKRKMNITIKSASAHAIEKIKKAGGNVIIQEITNE